MKNSIIPTLINTASNETLLGGVPHRQLMDISVVYRFIKEDENGFSTALITDAMLGELKMTREELEAVAMENFRTKYMDQIFDLTDKLKIVTNSCRLFGAAGILFEELLEEAAQSFEKDYYIIPVSVHELMLVPEGAVMEDEMTSILREGNENIASPDEVLSYNIYKYRILEKTLEVVAT